ncbi:MAG: 50S ribosomal protein L21 [Gemmatimonadales bacterium]|nr:50S ribosomal protein L21 [Gemmatimonadales bacterium]NIN12438.1 50S ribosomal protein L21 [Gemmatimonadales bacterium]NIN50814.1 50S ribosomal protein L21 [Gemmatimonadales bacterium]NIP08278.1 50S ribosomal protein L21 [Gemmatimonadales bacterium]NIR00802.1 50S ribosomal protein L21 [Gemmatimonadales bacterium]
MPYAIFKAAGQQFRAEKGAVLQVPKIEGEPGAKVTFDQVLLSSDGKRVKAGQPTVKGAKVVAQIVRHGRDDKIVVFKFKRRKDYRRKTGHRQPFTEIKITDVKLRS